MCRNTLTNYATRPHSSEPPLKCVPSPRYISAFKAFGTFKYTRLSVLSPPYQLHATATRNTSTGALRFPNKKAFHKAPSETKMPCSPAWSHQKLPSQCNTHYLETIWLALREIQTDIIVPFYPSFLRWNRVGWYVWKCWMPYMEMERKARKWRSLEMEEKSRSTFESWRPKPIETPRCPCFSLATKFRHYRLFL